MVFEWAGWAGLSRAEEEKSGAEHKREVAGSFGSRA
jgi:hypothetical protein